MEANVKSQKLKTRLMRNPQSLLIILIFSITLNLLPTLPIVDIKDMLIHPAVVITFFFLLKQPVPDSNAGLLL